MSRRFGMKAAALLVAALVAVAAIAAAPAARAQAVQGADQPAVPGGPDDFAKPGGAAATVSASAAGSAAPAAPAAASGTTTTTSAASDGAAAPAAAAAAAAPAAPSGDAAPVLVPAVTDLATPADTPVAEPASEAFDKAAAELAAKNAEDALVPLPTEPYDERTVHGGIEYAGPVRTARHVVLDTHGKCGAFGNPATVYTFDQRGYGFRGEGAFVMFRLPPRANSTDPLAPEEEVQVMEERTPAPRSVSRVVAAAFRAGGSLVEVRLVRAGDRLRPYVTVDGADSTELVLGQDSFTTPSGAFVISRDGVFDAPKPLILAVRSTAGTGTTVAVTFEVAAGVHHLNVFVEASSALIQRPSGLCGNYDFDAGNDMVLDAATGKASPAATARRWVPAAGAALFSKYVSPQADELVVAEPLQPADLQATADMVGAARAQCEAARRDFSLPCVMNALVAGEAGVAEVNGAQEILLENSLAVTPNMTACLANFFLAPWGAFGACTVPCGAGTTNRTRAVFDGESRLQCGTITQFRKCVTQCDHVHLPGKCAVFGDPHVVTFDQRMYDYRGTGEYVLYHSTDDREQVNVVLDRSLVRPNRTAVVSWVTGAAFRVGPDVFSAHMTDPADDLPVFRFNGRLLGGLAGPVSYLGLFTIRKSGELRGTSRNNLILELTAPGGTQCTLVFYKTEVAAFMNVFVTVGGSKIEQTQGLCGSYDFKPENDLTSDSGAAVAPQAFGWSWAVDGNHTLFGDAVPAAALPPSPLPASARLIGGADGSYDEAVRACQAAGVPKVLRDACVIDSVTLGPQALRMIQDVGAVVEEGKISVQYVAQGCLVAEGSYLGPWGDWSDCSRACGGGETTRQRGVFAYTGEQCSTVSESRECNTQPCPVDCEVGPWRDWAPCSATCGNGTETRTRGVVVEQAAGGAACPPLLEDRPCQALPCCVVGNWTAFGPCRSDGTQERRREVNFPARCGNTTETRTCCYADPWPVSSRVMNATHSRGAGGLEIWGECIDGEQRRTRRVFPEHCAAAEERRPCCETGAWSGWGSCVDGIETRWRTVLPNNCSHSTEHRVCCTRYAWSGWSACSGGTRNRTREVLPLGCDSTRESEACCHFGDWVNSTGCVMGTQTLTRVVDPPACGKAVMQVECCSAGEWGAWSRCRRGNHTRLREVYGREGCMPKSETEPCIRRRSNATAKACVVLPHCSGCPCVSHPTPCKCATCPCRPRLTDSNSVEPVYADMGVTSSSAGATTILTSAGSSSGSSGSGSGSAGGEVVVKTVPAGSLSGRRPHLNRIRHQL